MPGSTMSEISCFGEEQGRQEEYQESVGSANKEKIRPHKVIKSLGTYVPYFTIYFKDHDASFNSKPGKYCQRFVDGPRRQVRYHFYR